VSAVGSWLGASTIHALIDDRFIATPLRFWIVVIAQRCSLQKSYTTVAVWCPLLARGKVFQQCMRWSMKDCLLLWIIVVGHDYRLAEEAVTDATPREGAAEHVQVQFQVVGSNTEGKANKVVQTKLEAGHKRGKDHAQRKAFEE
jgi:hypothetical protein